MAKSDLYKISGHWIHFAKKGMFVFEMRRRTRSVCASPDDLPVPVLCI